MAVKPAARRRSSRAGAGRQKDPVRATTYRLSPHFQRGLALLGQLRRVPANRMVNEAVGEYLRSQTAAVEAELKETLRRVSAYREADPGFEAAIAKFAQTEAAFGADDPAEGKTTPATGPAQRLVRALLRG